MTDEQTSAMANVQDAAAALNRAIAEALDEGLETEVIVDRVGARGAQLARARVRLTPAATRP